MKKKLLFILIMVFAFIPFVKADMGAPEGIETNVKVTNKNGTILCNNVYHEETQDYERKCDTKVNYGVELLAPSWGSPMDENGYINIEYNEEGYLVLARDITAIKPYDISEARKLPETTIYNINENAYLYSGPSYAYDKVTKKIPLWTKFTYNLGSGYTNRSLPVSFSSSEVPLWAYVEYNGVKGWYCTFSGSITTTFAKETTDSIYLYKDEKIYESYEGKKVVATVPNDMEVKTLYGAGFFTPSYYVEVNGIKGWVKHSSQKVSNNVKITVIDDNGINVLKSPFGEENKTILIPKGTELIPDIIVENFKINSYRVTYQGQTGWLQLLFYDQYTGYLFEIDGNKYGALTKTEDNIYTPLTEEEIQEEVEEEVKKDLDLDYDYDYDEEKLTYEEGFYVGVIFAIIAIVVAVVLIKLIKKLRRKKLSKKQIKQSIEIQEKQVSPEENIGQDQTKNNDNEKVEDK